MNRWQPVVATLALLTAGIGMDSALAQSTRVGIAYDLGGKNDRSFNQSAGEGAARAEEELGVQVFDFEPTDASQSGQGVRKFAEEGFDLVIGVGFALEPPITSAAQEFEDVNFALIDSVSSETDTVASLIFQEHEGSFLVGYIAGKLTQTGVVGFLGGMDIPLIHRFEAGYKAGVEYACEQDGINCQVIANYVGTTPAAWNDPAKAKEIGSAQLSQGADIIYTAAGGSGLGVIDLVKQEQCLSPSELPGDVEFIRDPFAEVPKPQGYTCDESDRPVFFIGVDANQNYLGDTDADPTTLNFGLASMLKRVDVATYDTIKAVHEGSFSGGIQEFGLDNEGVGYAMDEFNQALISEELISEVEAVKQQILDGEISVPEERS